MPTNLGDEGKKCLTLLSPSFDTPLILNLRRIDNMISELKFVIDSRRILRLGDFYLALSCSATFIHNGWRLHEIQAS